MVFSVKIETKKFNNGERYVFLMDEEGIPDFWVTFFVTLHLRVSHTAQTIKNYLDDLRHLKLWEKINDRDLLEEIYNGKIPNHNDIQSIQEHCQYQVKSFKAAKANKVATNENIVDMGKYARNKDQGKLQVSMEQQQTRVSRIAEFLHVVGTERVRLKPTAAELFDKLNTMKEKLKAGKPKGKRGGKLNKTAITDDDFIDFVAVAKPDSIHNPFKDPKVKLRNHLIVQTLYETGIRLSELLAIQIGDINTDIQNPEITVERRHDNPDDPRENEPTAKTLGREIGISTELRAALEEYINSIRNKMSAAKRHPFIFVTHKTKQGHYEKGDPLQARSVNVIFDKISTVNPERFALISPHRYRDFFNDQLSESIDKTRKEVANEVKKLEGEGKPLEAKQYFNDSMITEANELEMRAYLNGHSNEKSGEVYLKRTVKRKAKSVRQKMQKELQQKVEKKYGKH